MHPPVSVKDEAAPAQAASASQPLPMGSSSRQSARLFLASALVAAAIWTSLQFLPALLWSGMLAIAVWPLYERVSLSISNGPSTASALLFTGLAALMIFFPISLAIFEIAQQSDVVTNLIKDAHDNGVVVPQWVSRLPIAADHIAAWWRDNLAKPESATALLQSLNVDSVSNFLKAFGGQLSHRFFLLFVSLIALFVILRDGKRIARDAILTADRILGHPGEGLVEKTVVAIRGTINGTVIVAVCEGLLIGLSYFVCGVPHSLMFLILTIAFAMLPFGAWVVFTAAAISLLISGGDSLVAAGVFLWGVIVMLAGDHFIWPMLVGGAARLPFLFAFIGIVGGLASFGLIGLFLGPVIMAALLAIWREWIIRDGSRSA